MQVYIDPTLFNKGIELFLWNETLILILKDRMQKGDAHLFGNRFNYYLLYGRAGIFY
jgi:hypothetical protein